MFVFRFTVCFILERNIMFVFRFTVCFILEGNIKFVFGITVCFILKRNMMFVFGRTVCFILEILRNVMFVFGFVCSMKEPFLCKGKVKLKQNKTELLRVGNGRDNTMLLIWSCKYFITCAKTMRFETVTNRHIFNIFTISTAKLHKGYNV